MTVNRRRWILLAAGMALVLGTLVLPGVHWRLYGWARGEAFYLERPTSYWSAEIAACEARPSYRCGMSVADERPQPLWVFLVRRPSSLDRVRQWLAGSLSWPNLAAGDSPPPELCDPSALPVLTVLLADPDPKTRYFAAQAITMLREAGRPALPALRALADDRGVIFDWGRTFTP